MEMKPFIELYSGLPFWYDKLDENTYDINDIAHALSMQCRYNGHCNYFYSVAEHCILMFDYAQYTLNITDNNILRTILMHDASEAYLSDIPRPLKQLLPDYIKVEKELENVLAKEFKLIYPFPEIVKELDNSMLKVERNHVKVWTDNIWSSDHLPLLPIKLKGWTPKKSEKEYLQRYYMVE